MRTHGLDITICGLVVAFKCMSKRILIRSASLIGVLIDLFNCGVVFFFMSLVTKSIDIYPMMGLKYSIRKVREIGVDGSPSIEVRATTSLSVDMSAYAVGLIVAHAAKRVCGVWEHRQTYWQTSKQQIRRSL